MRFKLAIVALCLLTAHVSAVAVPAVGAPAFRQVAAAQSPELAEAERLSAQVVSLYGERKYDEALPLAERVLAIREHALGQQHELVAAALRNIAELQAARKKSKEAEAAFARYIDVYGRAVGADSPKLVEPLERYVCLLVGINQREKALDAQKRLYKLDNGFEYDESANRTDRDVKRGGLMIGRNVSSPPPAYSEEAKRARVTGPVVMKITVDEAGRVVALKTLCGHPLLVKGAEQSISAARYAPTVVAGQPAKVTGVAIYNFAIQ